MTSAPDWQAADGSLRLYRGDALAIAPALADRVSAVIGDPPYGCANDCDYTRFRGGLAPSRRFKGIAGDRQPFDPSPWLAYPKVILWGYQFFAQRLPLGTVLVWNKHRPNQLGKYLSDAELAWQKGGYGCYVFNHVWRGFDRESERGQKTLHPTQKPVALFRWCIDRLKLRAGDTVLDPYMGSGSCGVACRERGINYIGCEIDAGHFDVARMRLESGELALAA